MTSFQKNFSFTVGNEIQNICNPLFDSSGITYFEYIKSYADGSFLTLTNNLAWLEHYFNQEYYKISFTRNAPATYKEGYILTSTLAQGNRCVKDAADLFQMEHCISLIEPSQNSCEFYIFAAPPSHRHILNFYLNNLDVLKKFTYYFHDKAAAIIANHTKNKFKAPLHVAQIAEPVNSLQTNLENNMLLPKRYRLFQNRREFLTQKETECIYWLSQGKTSEEIGMMCGLSKRTIETHILHAKKKLRCYKTTHLIYLAQKLALI